ncbi:MAG: ComEC/Rec2 family competence protein [Prochlorotrichaceae cyanobacterium]
MFTPDLILWGIAYVVGLGITAIEGHWGSIPVATLVVSLASLGAAAIVPRWWWSGPRPLSWVIAAAIVWLAALNLSWQTPRPQAQDISVLLQQQPNPIVTVRGTIHSIPTLNSSNRVRFELEVAELQTRAIEGSSPDQNSAQSPEQKTQGCLYTTVPLLQGTGLRSGQEIQVTGLSYQPKPANNPAGFDFQQYLARQGCFAGLSGQQVKLLETKTSGFAGSNFGWWKLRQRILQAQVGALGSPDGTLVSAMVMGSRSVDLPQTVRQDFARAGLAHTIAASGFHVSLLLGVVLWLTQGRSPLLQGITGVFSLLGFIGLTGPQPSILRAVLMGSAGLLGLVLQRRTKPLGILGLVGILLLLIRPLWIWDLGFQLSFLATFGLVTTATPVSQRLDFLPSKLASLCAVPIAAMIWTVPVLLYQFGVFSPYSLGVNIIATLPIAVISLGGMISGLAAIVSVPLGTLLAHTLYFPVKALFLLVKGCLALPGATLAVGSISPLQLGLLYGLFLLIWLHPAPWLRWGSVGLAIVLTLVPNWYSQARLSQLTIVAGGDPPVMILQDQGKAAIVNSGGEDTVRYTLLPYLQNQGINRLVWAVPSRNTLENREGWLRLLTGIKVDRFFSHPDSGTAGDIPPWEQWSREALQTALTQQQTTIAPLSCAETVDISPTDNQCTPALELGRWQLTLLHPSGSLWRIIDQTDPTRLGFFLLSTEAQSDLELAVQNLSALRPWLWWTGESLKSSILDAVPWQWAVASRSTLDPETIAAFGDRSIPLYWTGRDGAVQWQPQGEIQTTTTLND